MRWYSSSFGIVRHRPRLGTAISGIGSAGFFCLNCARKAAAAVILVSMISHDAAAFCGFYVSKADGTLKNKTSQVIIVHDGDRSTITMYNDFKGDLKDFAMVVPVPVVLKEKDIKVVDQKIFTTLNDYSQPRLVEYWDENPCERREYERMSDSSPSALSDKVVSGCQFPAVVVVKARTAVPRFSPTWTSGLAVTYRLSSR